MKSRQSNVTWHPQASLSPQLSTEQPLSVGQDGVLQPADGSLKYPLCASCDEPLTDGPYVVAKVHGGEEGLVHDDCDPSATADVFADEDMFADEWDGDTLESVDD